jgi:hypothetical protein
VTHRHKSKLARRVTRLENRHLRMMTQLHNEIRALEVKLTPSSDTAEIVYRRWPYALTDKPTRDALDEGNVD